MSPENSLHSDHSILLSARATLSETATLSEPCSKSSSGARWALADSLFRPNSATTPYIAKANAIPAKPTVVQRPAAKDRKRVWVSTEVLSVGLLCITECWGMLQMASPNALPIWKKVVMSPPEASTARQATTTMKVNYTDRLAPSTLWVPRQPRRLITRCRRLNTR